MATLPRGKEDMIANVNIDLHPLLKIRMFVVIPPLPPVPLWCAEWQLYTNVILIKYAVFLCQFCQSDLLES
jgi:hypothetical protein